MNFINFILVLSLFSKGFSLIDNIRPSYGFSSGYLRQKALLQRGTGMEATTSEVASDAPKKLGKVEAIKVNSNYLRDPLATELENDAIFVGPDAVVVLKYHGSYMQDNRDNRKKGVEKEYSFMLRLKSPAGEIPPHLYKELDHLADEFGQGDLRATTRQGIPRFLV